MVTGHCYFTSSIPVRELLVLLVFFGGMQIASDQLTNQRPNSIEVFSQELWRIFPWMKRRLDPAAAPL